MTLHLIKLSVGSESVESLRLWQGIRLAEKRKKGDVPELFHTTRMAPTRRGEILNTGGSIYWVIRGLIQARQRLTDIRPFKDDQGVKRCHLVLDPVLVPTVPRRSRPFQGWRYYAAGDAPVDLDERAGIDAAMPPEMQRQLAELGLI